MEPGVVDLRKIMIFGCHPVNRHKVMLRISRFQIPGEPDGGRDLENKVQWPGKDIQLVACGNRKGIGLLQSPDIGRYRRCVIKQASILGFECCGQQLPYPFGKRRFVLYLFPEPFQRWLIAIKGGQTFISCYIRQQGPGKTVGITVIYIGCFH